MIGLIILLIIIFIVYPHVTFRRYISGFPTADHTDVGFKTGDIIMAKYDTPVYYYARNGLNITGTFGKYICDGVQYWSQGRYTHAGVVMVVNGEPYVYHLSDDICFDKVSNQYTSCEPMLVPMVDFMAYHGVVVLYRLQTATQISPRDVIKNTTARNIQMQSNALKTIAVNGLGIGKNSPNKYVCTDFVEDVLYQLRILDGATRNTNLTTIRKIIDKKYADPVLLRTYWYNHVYA